MVNKRASGRDPVNTVLCPIVSESPSENFPMCSVIPWLLVHHSFSLLKSNIPSTLSFLVCLKCHTYPMLPHCFCNFLKDFIFLQRDRKGGRKRRKHPCVVASCKPQLGTQPATQACALTGNQTSNPLICRLVLNPLSHTNRVCFCNFYAYARSSCSCIKHLIFSH